MWVTDRLLGKAAKQSKVQMLLEEEGWLSACLHHELLKYICHASVQDKTGMAELSSAEINVLSDPPSPQAEAAAFPEGPWACQGLTFCCGLAFDQDTLPH